MCSPSIVRGGLDASQHCASFGLMKFLDPMLHTGSRDKVLLVGAVLIFMSGLVYSLFMAAWPNVFFLVEHMGVIKLAAEGVAVALPSINLMVYFWLKEGSDPGVLGLGGTEIAEQSRRARLSRTWPRSSGPGFRC